MFDSLQKQKVITKVFYVIFYKVTKLKLEKLPKLEILERSVLELDKNI